MPDSRRKGARGERDFISKHLAAVWPDAKRNLDQHSEDKRDVAKINGYHFQIKYVERLNIWAAIKQAEQEAIGSDLPIVAFRRNRSRWYCALDADDLMMLLLIRDRRDGR